MFVRPSRSLALLALAAVAAGLSGCGAGVISGIIAGSGDGGSSPVAEVQPSVTLSVDRGPLELAPGERYEVAAVLSNLEVPPASQVVVELVEAEQPSIVQPQAEVVLDQSDTDTIRWRLVTDAIRELHFDPTLRDVETIVRISARDELGTTVVLNEQPFTLLRKRVARLAGGDGTVIPVSGGLVTLDVSPRLAEAPQLEVGRLPSATTVAGLVSREDDEDLDTTRITVAIPAGETPQELELVVIDRNAGRSTRVHGVFYGPEILGVTVPSGSTDGDDRISLVGDGLIPLDFTILASPMPDPERVELAFRKGPREVVVPSTLLAPSTPEALTLRSPISPDGHPGPVSIEVRVRVPRIDGSGGSRVVSDAAFGLFAYAASIPSFEPRGVAIQESPSDVDFAPLTLAPAESRSGDAAILFRDAVTENGLVRVFTGNEHGMLRRIGPFVRTGAPAVPSVAEPVDLCIGDFVGDGFYEVVVGHFGQGAPFWTSTLLRNGEDRRGLLREFESAFDMDRITRELSRVDLDRDGNAEVFLSAIDDAGIALSSLGQAPVWFRDLFPDEFPVGGVPVARPIDFERDGLAEALCIVRTGRDELLTVRATSPGELRAFGPYPLDGLLGPLARTTHAVSLGVDGERAILGLVVEVSPAPQEEIQLVVLELVGRDRPVVRAAFELPRTPDGRTFDVSHVLAEDIDDDGRIEWVVGSQKDGLRIYEATPFRLEIQDEFTELGEEPLGTLYSIDFAPVSNDRNALYVTHDVAFDTLSETRVTTALLDDAGRVVSSKARRDFAVGESILQTVTIDESGQRIGLLFGASIRRFSSDEFGELTLDDEVFVGDVLPDTLRRVDVGGTSAIAYLLRDGRLGLLREDENVPRVSPYDLRADIGTGVGTMSAASRIAAGEFDGDGIQDLAVLVGVQDGAAEESFGLVHLPGRPSAAAAPFPFQFGSTTTSSDLVAPGSIAAGQFVLDVGARVDELAVAIPSRGIRFWEFENGRFRGAEMDPQRAFLSEGRAPDVVLALDLDRNGVDDVVALSLTRNVVRIYLQQDPRFSGVNVAGYGFADDAPAPIGSKGELLAADIDGDDLDDIVVSVVDAFGRPTVGALLWDGTDRIRSLFTVPSARIIGRNLEPVPEDRDFSFTVADTNHDGTVDIVIGWGEDPGGQSPSFVHTLFGSRR